MPKPNKNEATLALENVINSQEFKDYHSKEHASRIILAKMQDILDKKHITQEELAEKMNMSQPSISRLLNGNRPNFSVQTLIKFCDAVGTQISLV